MKYNEPKLKKSCPSASPSLRDTEHNDNEISLLYLLDTSSDRALEIDLNSIPRGPEDGPTWAQHDFSDTLSQYGDNLISPPPKRMSAAEAAEEVTSVLTDLLRQPVLALPPAETQPKQLHTKDTDLDPAEKSSSSTDSELARLYG